MQRKTSRKLVTLHSMIAGRLVAAAKFHILAVEESPGNIERHIL